MRLRTVAAATAMSVATTLGGGALFVAMEAPSQAAAAPATAAASRTQTSLTQQIPCTLGGGASTCTLQVTSFSVVNGVLQAAGTVTGGGVTVPFSGVPVLDPPAACPVLALTLGPLHLDLLGLVVDLNQVVLNITAQPGPGQLLGNLLCAVSNLLNGSASTTAVTQLLSLLNGLLGGL